MSAEPNQFDEPPRCKSAAASRIESAPGGNIPLWVKAAYTGFLCILVPYYWNAYGPTNFLYFCDVALFMALVAVWTEKSIWASMPAVGILIALVTGASRGIGKLWCRWVILKERRSDLWN